MTLNKSQKFPSRENGKKTWQYHTWVRLLTHLENEGFQDSDTADFTAEEVKLTHSDLLDYQRFYPIITSLKDATGVEGSVFVFNFFGDTFVSPYNIFYLPKRLVQNYQELSTINSMLFNLTTTGYRVRAVNAFGLNKHLGTFKTLPEAQEAYRSFKSKVIIDIFDIYKGFLPAHFCSRFEKEILNALR